MNINYYITTYYIIYNININIISVESFIVGYTLLKNRIFENIFFLTYMKPCFKFLTIE